ncbi:MAG: cation:proton antiporter [Marinibacterium sp.]|nr:cation:proton antiporter [Marinibacterium sp.]
MTDYLIIVLVLLTFCMFGQRLSSTVLTAPMIFLGFGVLVGEVRILPAAEIAEALHVVAEITLVILLFLDAAQIDVRALRKGFAWPARMLLIGMPLALVLGMLSGAVLLPHLDLVALALLAAILVPTDAALGQPVVSNPDIPERPRRALIVESGLNDGLALPAILMLAFLAAPAAEAPAMGWLWFGVLQVTLGPAAGLAVGLVGGTVLLWAKERRYTSPTYEGIGALALATSAYLLADIIGGNGFIAAFSAGLAFGAIVRGRCDFVFEFTESEGQFLAWAAFFLLGAALVPKAIEHLDVPMLLFILASLFIVRPVAIWLSLAGTDARPMTRAFFGWFGPRGLATALFALMVVEDLGPELGHTILFTAINAVWISALLHGLTAAPLSRLYARRIAARAETHGPMAETQPTPAMHDSQAVMTETPAE